MLNFLGKMIKGCSHEFELVHYTKVRVFGKGVYYCKVFMCKKCEKTKKVKSK